MSTGQWTRRLWSWRNEALRWARMRGNDVAWMHARRDFLRQWPRFLSTHRLVFVVGCNNSGTTLIHDVLAATGRFSFMLHEGQRYTDALRRSAKRGHERVWIEYLDELRLSEADPVDCAPRLMFDWLRQMQRPVCADILEKTPANVVRLRWLERAFPGAAFIGVVRNGYAVAEGIRRKGGKSIQRGARHWSRVNEIMLDDARYLSRFLLVRYEEFVDAPAQTLPRLAQFLGQPLAPLQAAFERPEQGSGAVRNQNEPSLGRLSAHERQLIERDAGSMLQRLGYPVPA